jgi:hypothetical protein
MMEPGEHLSMLAAAAGKVAATDEAWQRAIAAAHPEKLYHGYQEEIDRVTEPARLEHYAAIAEFEHLLCLGHEDRAIDDWGTW